MLTCGSVSRSPRVGLNWKLGGGLGFKRLHLFLHHDKGEKRLLAVLGRRTNRSSILTERGEEIVGVSHVLCKSVCSDA